MPLLEGISATFESYTICTYELSSLHRLKSFQGGWFIYPRTSFYEDRNKNPKLILPISVHRYALQNTPLISHTALGKQISQLPRLKDLEISPSGDGGHLIASVSMHAKLRVLKFTSTPLKHKALLLNDLLHHPTLANLVVLNCDSALRSPRDEAALTQLLSIIPETLRYLSLKESYLTKNHVSLLTKICSHLEELQLGNPTQGYYTSTPTEYKNMLYMTDIEIMVLSRDGPKTLRRLDISGLSLEVQLELEVSLLLDQASRPLEIIIVLDHESFDVEGWRWVRGKGKLWMIRK